MDYKAFAKLLLAWDLLFTTQDIDSVKQYIKQNPKSEITEKFWEIVDIARELYDYAHANVLITDKEIAHMKEIANRLKELEILFVAKAGREITYRDPMVALRMRIKHALENIYDAIAMFQKVNK